MDGLHRLLRPAAGSPPLSALQFSLRDCVSTGASHAILPRHLGRRRQTLRATSSTAASLPLWTRARHRGNIVWLFYHLRHTTPLAVLVCVLKGQRQSGRPHHRSRMQHKPRSTETVVSAGCTIRVLFCASCRRWLGCAVGTPLWYRRFLRRFPPLRLRPRNTNTADMLHACGTVVVTACCAVLCRRGRTSRT